MMFLFLSVIVHVGDLPKVFAQSSGSPLNITAQQVQFDRVPEIFRATGSVVVTQGPLRLTADQATIQKLSGALIAKGKVHLKDQATDIWAEEMEINVHTEAGIITNGKIFLQKTRTWITGRLLQRFSETHLRAKDGTFTNCDADDGQIPDWSFEFEDVDLEQGDSIFAKNVWLQVRKQRVIPLPILRYPLPGARKTGFLVPTAGYDNVLGWQYRQDFFWAISPSQDLLVTPQIMSERGVGTNLSYRYIFSRQSRGNWLIDSIYDSPIDKIRAQITGLHEEQINKDLRIHAQINYATDRFMFRDLGSSGLARAFPSQTSTVNFMQRLPRGSLHFEAQYIQPLNLGTRKTFQRLPEIRHRYRTPAFGNQTFIVDLDTQFVHFWREQGFHISRLALMPTISTQGLHFGHIVGLRPQMKFREALYSHGRTSSQEGFRERGTVWLGLEAVSNLSRRFPLGQGHRLRHTIQPSFFYEYVPHTTQSDLPQLGGVDNLPKKHLLTYSLNTRLKDERSRRGSTTLLDLTITQSYHLGETPGRANVFSDMWGQARVGLPTTQLPPFLSIASISFDTFFDPGDKEFSQFNTSMTLQAKQAAYIEVGHRYTRAGLLPQRGDMWNPASFNEVLAPQGKINFLTLGGAVRTPFGWTVGSKVYHDLASGETPQWDVVALYQNPCRCWSFGVYYTLLNSIQGRPEGEIPERNMFNFVLTLRGVGATESKGTAVLREILGPLMQDEEGLPWLTSTISQRLEQRPGFQTQ
ncbi:MAG: LPS assembly protein LptD [Nitrospirota bacterium]|nr:LPS assembly protein LptD [Nitrospirota bacterium]